MIGQKNALNSLLMYFKCFLCLGPCFLSIPLDSFWVPPLCFIFRLARGLPVFLLFSKNQNLVSLVTCTLWMFSVLFMSVLIFYISFFIIPLSLFSCSLANFLCWMFGLLIFGLFISQRPPTCSNVWNFPYHSLLSIFKILLCSLFIHELLKEGFLFLYFLLLTLSWIMWWSENVICSIQLFVINQIFLFDELNGQFA